MFENANAFYNFPYLVDIFAVSLFYSSVFFVKFSFMGFSGSANWSYERDGDHSLWFAF